MYFRKNFIFILKYNLLSFILLENLSSKIGLKSKINIVNRLFENWFTYIQFKKIYNSKKKLIVFKYLNILN